MTTPTPRDSPPFDPPVFCSGIERDCEHGQLARSCEICELKSDLAAAQERIRELETKLTVGSLETVKAAQEARDQAIAIARELARLACCMDAPAPGSIGTQVAKLDALEARIGVAP